MVNKYFRHVADCSKTEICEIEDHGKTIYIFGSSISRHLVTKTIPDLKYRIQDLGNPSSLAISTVVTGAVDVLSYVINKYHLEFPVLTSVAFRAIEHKNMKIFERVISDDYPECYYEGTTSMADEISNYFIFSRTHLDKTIVEFLVSSLNGEYLNDPECDHMLLLIPRILEYNSVKCHRFVLEKIGVRRYVSLMITELGSKMDPCLRLLRETDIDKDEIKSLMSVAGNITGVLQKALAIVNVLNDRLEASKRLERSEK
jgi:hypothetical protein